MKPSHPKHPAYRFWRWLHRKHSNEVVGFSRSCRNCPVGIFLRRKVRPTGVFKVYEVSLYYIDNSFNLRQCPLPLWTRLFIKSLDKMGFDQPVNAKQALWHLTQACANAEAAHAHA